MRSDKFWSQIGQGKRVTCVVNAIGKHGGMECYVHDAPPSDMILSIPINHYNIRKKHFRSHLDKVRDELLKGNDVAVFCNSGFHRAPLLAAVLSAAAFGTEPREFMRLLSAVRIVWPGHLMLPDEARAAEGYAAANHDVLIDGMVWADTESRIMPYVSDADVFFSCVSLLLMLLMSSLLWMVILWLALTQP